jgi:hypothetical protein
MREVLQRLRDSGAAGCVLVGDPGFYQRFKFRSHTALAYPDVPAEVFLVLPFGGAVPPATVRFTRRSGRRAEPRVSRAANPLHGRMPPRQHPAAMKRTKEFRCEKP